MYATGIAAINKKFFKKAADKVWAMKLPEFDAKKQIPDSLLENASAVIIAVHDNAEIDLNTIAPLNRTEEKLVTRVMAKILDKSALDNFSTFEFVDSKGPTVKLQGILLREYKSAFGARIYKPDGRVIDVNVEEAYEVTSGKNKDKTDGYKLAIPGLEIGDVIEYFYYDENYANHLSIRPLRFDIMHKYPTLSYTVSGFIHQDLTVEYRNYNGAPNIEFSAPENFKRHFEAKLENIPAEESGIGLLPERQNPFVKMFVTNSTARLEYHPSTGRSGGVYRLMTGTVYRDILSALRSARYESILPGKAVSAAKNFAKQHPDADQNAIIDAAWLALNYYNYTEEKDEEDIWLSIYFNDVVKKLGYDVETAVGFLNSRSDVATNELISWRQPDYLSIVGDRYYLPGMECCIPGELPGKYQGEEGGSFPSSAMNSEGMLSPTIFNAPTTKSAQNQKSVNTTVNIDGNTLNVVQRTELSGSRKQTVEEAIYIEDWLGDIEDYLGIAENKRYNIKVGDKEDHDKEREKFLTEDIAIGPDVTPKVNKLEVESHGILPTSPKYAYTLDCSIEGLVSEAGNDIIVNIGKLFGDNYVMNESERESRVNNYCRVSPQDIRYKVQLNLPEGYTIKEGTLEELQLNAKTQAGQYFVKASYDEESNAIEISTLERFPYYIVSADFWQDVVTIYDAAAKFNSASIVLTRK